MSLLSAKGQPNFDAIHCAPNHVFFHCPDHTPHWIIDQVIQNRQKNTRRERAGKRVAMTKGAHGDD
jgi:hypothetical protein